MGRKNSVAGQLFVNLSSLSGRPTGLSVYSQNVVPHLAPLDPIVLIRGSEMGAWQSRHPEMQFEPISNDLSSDSGAPGHARRLAWIETSLRRRLSQAKQPVLFSPVPEAPLSMRLPTVVTVHDFTALRYFPKAHPLRMYTQHYVPRVLARAETVLAYSRSTERDAIELAQVEPSKITVAPLACDTEHFRDLGLTKRRYFVYLGRYAAYKNIETALRAFELASLADTEFWLAGPPDPGFQRLLAEFRDRKRLAVKFIEYPHYQDLPTLLGEALGMVFLSRSEGFGLPILEAMACGTPVISSNVSAMPEVSGDAAILVEPDDVEAVSSAMRQLATNGAFRDELSSIGSKRAREFSWATTADITLRSIEKLF